MCIRDRAWSAQLPADRQREVWHRYILGVYDLLERLQKRFPDILWEGCASGGGRFDPGMLYYFPQILSLTHISQEQDPNSALQYYRRLIAMRKQYPVFVHGDFVDCLPEDPQRYVYRRTLGEEKVLVLLNFSGEQTPFWQPDDMDPARWEMLLCNYPAPQDACGPLRPYEARVYYQKEDEPCEKI